MQLGLVECKDSLNAKFQDSSFFKTFLLRGSDIYMQLGLVECKDSLNAKFQDSSHAECAMARHSLWWSRRPNPAMVAGNKDVPATNYGASFTVLWYHISLTETKPQNQCIIA
ncbi:hypothetical protein U1Q18_047036 [Sarracenia purpurea var. burkii]